MLKEELKYSIKIKDLVSILLKYNQELPVIIQREGLHIPIYNEEDIFHINNFLLNTPVLIIDNNEYY